MTQQTDSRIVAECWTCRVPRGRPAIRFLCDACRGHGGNHNPRACAPMTLTPNWEKNHRAAGHDVRPVVQDNG